MINRKNTQALALGLALLLAAGLAQGQAAKTDVSGKLEAGVRVVTLDPASPAPVVRVYRGDAVRLALTTGEPFTVTVDSLKLTWAWPVPEGGAPVLKMNQPGRFAFTLGKMSGTFEVVEYQAASYREVDATEAAKLLADLKPFVLDVRTPNEFAEGHLQGATLLPVQQLEKRVAELAAHRKDPVFVYCHSGNRSTVAAKMLVDAGFENVINLRKGIVGWQKAGLPVVK